MVVGCRYLDEFDVEYAKEEVRQVEIIAERILADGCWD